jgi:transcriptional regulator with XRE-family HTH domain
MTNVNELDLATITPAEYPALTLAIYVYRRRQELGLSMEDAAERAGLELCQWCSIEGGWIPDSESAMASIARSLGVCSTQLALLAMIARS